MELFETPCIILNFTDPGTFLDSKPIQKSNKNQRENPNYRLQGPLTPITQSSRQSQR